MASPMNGSANKEVETDNVRSEMVSYWKEHSTKPTLECMMLDSQAGAINAIEAPEILSMLPDYSNQRVLELAAGIGRFTGLLAQKTQSLLAVEFMESFCEKNRELHGHLPNVTVQQGDVTALELPEGSFDLVFSNWLMMYLSDEETCRLAQNSLKWLAPGGHVFFRESCFKRSGDVPRTSNPTNYRHPSFYHDAFSKAFIEEADGTISKFELVSSRSVSAYRQLKGNQGQITWLWKKVNVKESVQDFQDFLDSQQYTRVGILRYEKIFGAGYVSTGGPETTEEFVASLQLEPGQRVLDVGCGIGGGDFYMSERYGAEVYGIDLSTNMVNIALERTVQQGRTDVQFEVCDATKKVFPENHFDVVYSRDTILHIEDKASLFAKFFKWLKPGGRLLISDYCCGEREHSDRFKAYVAQRGYHLLSVPAYGRVIESVGFTDVVAEDRSQQMIEILQKEMSRTEKDKEAFIQEFSEEDFNYLIEGWKAKVVRVGEGDQAWGLFKARKPL